MGTVNLQLQNFKNMPYIIPSGVNWVLYNFIRNGLRATQTYNAQTGTTANALVATSVASITQSAGFILQPNSIEINFLPFNKLPTTGQIIIEFPAGDWVFDNPYC
jgi:hypothetical protein